MFIVQINISKNPQIILFQEYVPSVFDKSVVNSRYRGQHFRLHLYDTAGKVSFSRSHLRNHLVRQVAQVCGGCGESLLNRIREIQCIKTIQLCWLNDLIKLDLNLVVLVELLIYYETLNLKCSPELGSLLVLTVMDLVISSAGFDVVIVRSGGIRSPAASLLPEC